MNTFLDIFSIFCILIFIGLSIKDVEKGILFGFLIKPLIDTSWDISLNGFSVIEFFSIIFLFLAFNLSIKKNLFRFVPKSILILWILAHFGILFSFTDPVDSMKSLLKCLYLPLAFCIIPYLLTSYNNNSVKLLKYLIIGACFSSIISILQFIGIIGYEFEHLSKGLQRSNGFYHDMVTSRIYVLQGLVTLTYIAHSKIFNLKKIFFWGLICVFMFSSYTLFSKAMIGLLIVTIPILLITNKIKISNIFIGIIFLVIFIYNDDKLITSTEQLFTKEIQYNEGELTDNQQLFSGRGSIWSEFLYKFENGTSIEQFFGFGINSGLTHNEFLRILILSGIIGLMAYTLFILSFIKNSIYFFITGNKFNFLNLFILTILLIDSFSVVWGLYPFYIIVIVGFYQTIVLSKYENKNATINTKIRIW